MKNWIITGMIAAMTFVVSAQTPPPTKVTAPVALPMITSDDALRNYAYDTVVRGVRFVQSASMDYQSSFTWTNIYGTSAENVLDKLMDVQFEYSQKNPDDKITGYVYLYDANNVIVFYGTTGEYSLAQASGKGGGPIYNVWFQNVSLLSGVESAEVLALNEENETGRSYPIQVRDGHVVLGSGYAGAKNGLLAVRLQNNKLATWSLSENKAMVPGVTREGNETWNIRSHSVYRTDGTSPMTVEIMALWELPTLLLTVHAGQEVTFNVGGVVQTEGGPIVERPMSIIGGPDIVVDPTKATKYKFPHAGTHRIRFGWRNFGQGSMLYAGPETGEGGKGGATAIAEK